MRYMAVCLPVQGLGVVVGGLVAELGFVACVPFVGVFCAGRFVNS